jgi:small-conductance mechanosensitive channel
MAKHKFIRNILLLIPAIVAYIMIDILFLKKHPGLEIVMRVTTSYMIAIVVLICNSGLQMISDANMKKGVHRNIPLRSLIQGIQIALYFAGGLVIVAVMLNKSPAMLLTGLGASAAVLMLVFKDSILGFVAGIQLTQNKMIRIGDWIQLPDGSANGIVEEITLNTVKVRNWDNTLSMIPPYTLVSAPFKNWRGMQESGGRRADKMIYIDVNSLEECTQEMADDMVKSFPLLKGKLPGSLGAAAAGAGAAGSGAAGSGAAGSGAAAAAVYDRLTNAQIYRTYIFAYLKQHPYVNPSLDIIVTQKEATPYGMPIEVYFFTREKDWALYEKQQSDIFDHLMSIAPEFGLRLYQRP